MDHRLEHDNDDDSRDLTGDELEIEESGDDAYEESIQPESPKWAGDYHDITIAQTDSEKEEDEEEDDDDDEQQQQPEKEDEEEEDPWRAVPPSCPVCEIVTGDMAPHPMIHGDAKEFNSLPDGMKLNWLKGALERYRRTFADLTFSDKQFADHFVYDHNNCVDVLEMFIAYGKQYGQIINRNIVKMRESTDPNARVLRISKNGLRQYVTLMKAVCYAQSTRDKIRNDNNDLPGVLTKKKKKF